MMANNKSGDAIKALAEMIEAHKKTKLAKSIPKSDEASKEYNSDSGDDSDVHRNGEIIAKNDAITSIEIGSSNDNNALPKLPSIEAECD
jgi:hypothetical protein